MSTVQKREKLASNELVIQVLNELITNNLTFKQAGKKYNLYPKTIAYWARKIGYKRVARRLDWSTIKKALEPVMSSAGNTKATVIATPLHYHSTKKTIPAEVMAKLEEQAQLSKQRKPLVRPHCIGSQPVGEPMSDEAYLLALKGKAKPTKPKRRSNNFEEVGTINHEYFGDSVEALGQF